MKMNCFVKARERERRGKISTGNVWVMFEKRAGGAVKANATKITNIKLARVRGGKINVAKA